MARLWGEVLNGTTQWAERLLERLPGDYRFVRRLGVRRFLRRALRWQLATRLLRKQLAIELSTGQRMSLPSDSANAYEIYLTEAQLDWGSEELLLQCLDPAGVFLDVGAHIGFYSLLVSPRVRQVWAFEPNPRVFHQLCRNAGRATNVEALPLAVSDRPGELQFVCARESTLSHLALNDAAPAEHCRNVRVTSLDAFRADRDDGFVTAIKIDVEGHDLQVLRGAGEVVRRDQPLILTEFNLGEGGNDPAAMAELLSGWRYRLYAILESECGNWQVQRRLLPVQASQLPSSTYQMLFLVPERLISRFEGFVRG